MVNQEPEVGSTIISMKAAFAETGNNRVASKARYVFLLIVGIVVPSTADFA
jgi:hypothetical protein